MLFKRTAKLTQLLRLSLKNVGKVVASGTTCLHYSLDPILQLRQFNRLTLAFGTHLLEFGLKAQSLFSEVRLTEVCQTLSCLTELSF